ncbi:MAG TPA: hypothetical protein VM869_32355 [Enhygromyxa sp.]|nr:hypothetical protein [Enhygromyxa sp.]
MDPERKALAKKLLIGVGGVTVVTAVGFGVWSSIMDRPPKFARVVAEDLPAESVGMLAFDDPAHMLELFDPAIPAELRAELQTELGFDPWKPDSYVELGFDLAAPMGVGIQNIEKPVFVFTMGLSDADKARATIHDWAEKIGERGWEQREFGGVDGMWLAEPPAAVVFRGDRLLVVGSEHGDADEVERVAEQVADLSARDSLAATNGFRSVHRFEGEPIVFGLFNMAEVEGTFMAAATIGATDVVSMAFALSKDDRDIHFITQTIMEKDSDYLRYMSGRSRSTAALDRVPGPVYGGMHWTIDPEYLRALMEQMGALGKNELDKARQEAERELGIDFERDVLGAWTGEFGVLWTGAGEDQWGGLVFAGVRDEAAAEQTLEQIWSRTEGDERERSDAGTIFRWQDEAAAKVWDGQLWLGVGHSRIEQVDDDEPFRKHTNVDAVADVVKSDSTGIAFFDLVAIREMVRAQPDGGEWRDRYAEVIDPLEAVTMDSVIDGETFVWTMTLHTTVDDAFDTLIERMIEELVEEQGDSMFDELLPRANCEAAVEHIADMTMQDLAMQQAGESAHSEIVDVLRGELRQMCEQGKLDTNCVLAASTLAETERCSNE